MSLLQADKARLWSFGRTRHNGLQLIGWFTSKRVIISRYDIYTCSYFSLFLLVQVFHFDVNHVSDHNKSLLTGSVNGVNPVYGSFTPPCKQNFHQTVLNLCFMLLGKDYNISLSIIFSGSLKSDSTNSLKTALNSPDSSFTTFYSCPPSRGNNALWRRKKHCQLFFF